MAELVHLTTSDGLNRVINLDHVVTVHDMPPNNTECNVKLFNRDEFIVRMTALQFAQLPRILPIV